MVFGDRLFDDGWGEFFFSKPGNPSGASPDLGPECDFY
jgi:hypothetical protein